MSGFESKSVPIEMDILAPDGSEIRFLPVLGGGSMVHCKLSPGAVTKAVRHKTVEELWYVTSGGGRLWRRSADDEAVVDLLPGSAHTIPLGVDFQFRCDSDTNLEIVIVTLPPWPDMDEAVPVADFWVLERGA